MNEKLKASLIIVAIVLAVTFGVVAAATLWQTMHPNTGNVPEAVGVSLRLNGNTFANGASVDWGVLHEGTQQHVLNVENVGNVAFTVTVTTESLPSGWTQTWTQEGATVTPGASVSGNLVLTIPADPEAGDYTWSMTVTGTSTT